MLPVCIDYYRCFETHALPMCVVTIIIHLPTRLRRPRPPSFPSCQAWLPTVFCHETPFLLRSESVRL